MIKELSPINSNTNYNMLGVMWTIMNGYEYYIKTIEAIKTKYTYPNYYIIYHTLFRQRSTSNPGVGIFANMLMRTNPIDPHTLHPNMVLIEPMTILSERLPLQAVVCLRRYSTTSRICRSPFTFAMLRGTLKVFIMCIRIQSVVIVCI